LFSTCFLTVCLLLGTGTGGRRVSARRAGRAELRRTSTGESGVVHRVPASASRPIGPCRATRKGTSPSATATRHHRLLRPGKGDVEADECTGLQHVRYDHLWESRGPSGCNVHDRQYCASRDRLAIVPHAAFIFPQRRRHLLSPRCLRTAPPPTWQSLEHPSPSPRTSACGCECCRSWGSWPAPSREEEAEYGGGVRGGDGSGGATASSSPREEGKIRFF
jgi:hypothetical protein